MTEPNSSVVGWRSKQFRELWKIDAMQLVACACNYNFCYTPINSHFLFDAALEKVEKPLKVQAATIANLYSGQR